MQAAKTMGLVSEMHVGFKQVSNISLAVGKCMEMQFKTLTAHHT